MSTHDPNLKGNVAELKIAAEAARLGIPVLRPMTEHERYDLVFELGGRLVRVQCKCATRQRDVVVVRFVTNRRGPNGYIRTKYTAHEIDAVAAYCAELDQCYYLPMELIAGTTAMHLRLAPARNGQKAALHFAADHDLGAVAQLGERSAGSRKVGGANPPSSTLAQSGTHFGTNELRRRLGWYMERAAAGESFFVTRRGKPYVRLVPARDRLPIDSPTDPPKLTVVESKEDAA